MMKKNKILIVDDNAENRKVLGSLLYKNGYDVGVAINGKKALEFVATIEPDLILLDVMMPEMDGFEVCKKLKENEFTRFIPVIFLTARTSTEDIVKGFDVGGVDYISKPFNAQELLARVRTHIEMKILRGILPVCSSCKSIRDDQGYWNSLEEYMSTHTESLLSHGLCHTCAEKLYGENDWFDKIKKNPQ
jgi:DNA-binding response OmpR family regulator